ncbi:MAG: radical SAM protein [Gammaproteobacteria bacterium]|nr:MAG: radical SAM protein [Gammaproteobacteria bacterium]
MDWKVEAGSLAQGVVGPDDWSSASAPFRVVLVNPYELGRQPFALAEPAAWLRRAGFDVSCIDLSRGRLDLDRVMGAGMVAVFLGMHTATRIAMELLPRLRKILPGTHLCAYGLYAPLNEALLRELGVVSLFGGECEPDLLGLAENLRSGEVIQPVNRISTEAIEFVRPDRHDLPPLEAYAKLRLADGEERVSGFAEASRGCKHLCRHCPVVPVYRGRFRIVPPEVVLDDVRQQVTAGARHISFGDPDFLNGPTHALRVVEALHAEFPEVSYDCTIKVEHLVRRPEVLPRLKETGCLWITTAVESLDEAVLDYLDKGHTGDDFISALASAREAGVPLAPTFVPFTPWTGLEGYVALLQGLLDLDLVNSVPPVQLSIRLLVPGGSLLLELDDFRATLGPFDRATLGHPWQHADPRVDALQRQVSEIASSGEAEGLSRPAIFARVWNAAHAALGGTVPALDGADFGPVIPALDEPWYCCAEPTEQQLGSF